MIFKAHHAFCDGVSVMAMTLASSAEFDHSYFIKTGYVPIFQRIFVRLTMFLHFPQMLIESVLTPTDKNSLMKNKANLSGNINITSAPVIQLSDIKSLSRKLKITINDIILSSLTTALHRVFEGRKEEVKEVNLTIPANIRFSFYDSAATVKLENKFAAIPLRVPLTSSMEAAYRKVTRISKKLRNNFSMVYSYYAVAFWGQRYVPRQLFLFGLSQVS